MFSTILIIVLLLVIWFLSGLAYMFLSMYRSEKKPVADAFFSFPVNFVMGIIKKFGKR